MTTPFIAPRGYLEWDKSALHHNLVREGECDVCHKPLVGNGTRAREPR